METEQLLQQAFAMVAKVIENNEERTKVETQKLIALQEIANSVNFQTRATKLMLELTCEFLTRYGSQDEHGFTDVKNSIREFLRNE